MSHSVNKVILLGNVGKDPEIKYTPSGTSIAKFTIATSRAYKAQDGEWKKETDWHNCTVWKPGKIFDSIAKGSRLYVEGRIQTRSHETPSGEKRYYTDIVCDDVVLLDSKDREKTPTAHQAAPAASSQQASREAITDDDVPF